MRGSALVVCVLAGCDPLASSAYVGQPMFTLEGTLTTPANATSSVGGIALLWQDPTTAGGPGLASTQIPVTLAFPNTFRAAVPVPPPDVARFRFADSDVELAEAYVFAVTDLDAPRPAPRGTDRAHVLVFASGDVAAGSLAADYLGGPVTAGYHLRRFVPAATPAAAQADMIERCVASGASRAACATRRGYNLAPLPDDDRLRIAVSP